LAKQTNPSAISSVEGLHFSTFLFFEPFDKDEQIVFDWNILGRIYNAAILTSKIMKVKILIFK